MYAIAGERAGREVQVNLPEGSAAPIKLEEEGCVMQEYAGAGGGDVCGPSD